MQLIDTEAALSAVTDPSLQPILDRFADMMDLATLYVIEPGDTLASLEGERGFPFELWEYVERHPGDWFEAVFIISDDGAGQVVLVPDRSWIDPELLALCRAAAAEGGEMIDL